MADKPRANEFGKRSPAPSSAVPPPKRSNHVALLVMGTLAVSGGAYALMPRESCQPAPSPGMAAPALPTTSTTCTTRTSSGGSGGYSRSSRLRFFGGDSSGGSSSTSVSSSGSVIRGGFGSFAHAFGFGGG
ncbi:MAG TPA: hypothetical protein VHJ00_21395 [Bradyrhizobium sp.]|jgi:hypothetical protein|nr:hypothetical protein [Bradyrhizobium sp.]